MIEAILHFLGLCPDSINHPNLLNLFGLTDFVLTIKYKIIQIKHKIVECIIEQRIK